METPETCRTTWSPSLWGYTLPGPGHGKAEEERQHELMQLKLQCRPRCCSKGLIPTSVALWMSCIDTCNTALNLLSVIQAASSTFQILGTFLLWPTLAQNHTGKEIPAQLSLLHTIYSSRLLYAISCFVPSYTNIPQVSKNHLGIFLKGTFEFNRSRMKPRTLHV